MPFRVTDSDRPMVLCLTAFKVLFIHRRRKEKNVALKQKFKLQNQHISGKTVYIMLVSMVCV